MSASGARWDDVPAVVNDLAQEVIGHALRVHDMLGPGLLERPYKLVLAQELSLAGHDVKVEYAVPLDVNGLYVPRAYVIDILVEDVLVVEIKSVRRLDFPMIAQTKTYLRLTGAPLGLLFNFHEPRLARGGIKRIVP